MRTHTTLTDLEPQLVGREWVFANGHRLPVIAGGDGPEAGDGGGDGGEGGDGDGGGDGGEGGDGRTLTQAEVDRIVARRAAEAKRAAERDLKTWLDQQKAEADEATLGEADRAKAEADRAKAEAESARAEAAAERQAAKVERALLKAGVPDKALDRAVRMVTLDPDATDDDITAEVDQLKTDLPALFEAGTGTGSGDGQGTGRAPSGKTTGGKPTSPATQTALQRGADRWRAKHPKPDTQAS